MNRRTLLGLLGSGTAVGVAGCVNVPEPLRSTPTVTDGLQRRVAIIDQNAVPDGHGVRIRAELLDRRITGESTATVRLTTTNEGEPRELSVGTGGCVLLNRERQGSDPAGLWLRRRAGMDQSDDVGPRWVATDLPASPGGFGGYGCAARTYASGESVATDYAVLHDGRVDGYLSSDEYRFEAAVTVGEPSPDSDGSTESFTWGFSMRVKDPD
ncbi:hypothetical protein [Halostella salina]|uniref:hypothetical protein n=1 Tax=Halostella salina TaxID=1547897 RepID=UPI000EF78ADE|nr:hypothetical protein [Halostella salina]